MKMRIPSLINAMKVLHTNLKNGPVKRGRNLSFLIFFDEFMEVRVEETRCPI